MQMRSVYGFYSFSVLYLKIMSYLWQLKINIKVYNDNQP